jgi:hypothetical protein
MALAKMTIWSYVLAAYIFAALSTLVPTLLALFSKVKLNSGGASFEQSIFTPETKERLTHHYSRIHGTLLFWKKTATQSQRFHYYCLCWTILSSSAMPFLTQAVDGNDPASKWLLTVISGHIALVLAFHRGFRVADKYAAFRHGESEFYDTYRRILDRPDSFGPDEATQVTKYFEEVEMIRKFVRNAETDTLPNVEDVRGQIAKSSQSS